MSFELFTAIQRNNFNVVKRLLASGADVNAPDEYGETPLHWATRYGHTALVEVLVANGADVNASDDNGDSPLHWAADNVMPPLSRFSRGPPRRSLLHHPFEASPLPCPMVLDPTKLRAANTNWRPSRFQAKSFVDETFLSYLLSKSLLMRSMSWESLSLSAGVRLGRASKVTAALSSDLNVVLSSLA